MDDLSLQWEHVRRYIYSHCSNIPCESNTGPEVIKLFSCSTQLSMKFIMLINLKLLTIANSFLLNIAEHENEVFLKVKHILTSNT